MQGISLGSWNLGAIAQKINSYWNRLRQEKQAADGVDSAAVRTAESPKTENNPRTGETPAAGMDQAAADDAAGIRTILEKQVCAQNSISRVFFHFLYSRYHAANASGEPAPPEAPQAAGPSPGAEAANPASPVGNPAAPASPEPPAETGAAAQPEPAAPVQKPTETAPAGKVPSAPSGRIFFIGAGAMPEGAIHLDGPDGLKGLKPGDAIYLGDGVFEGGMSIFTAGTEDSPISIQAAPGTHPVLEGTLLFGSSASNISVSGLEIRNSSNDSGIRMSVHSENIRISDCYIHDVGLNGIYCAGTGHVIQNNTITTTGLDDYPYGTHGIYIKGENILVDGNSCSDSRSGNGIRSEGINVMIQNNTSFDNLNHGISVFADVPTSGLSIVNNTVYDNAKLGITVLGGSGGNVPDGILIQGNTLYKNGTNLSVAGGSRNVSLIGNLLEDARRYQIQVDSSSRTGLVLDGNTLEGTGGTSTGLNVYSA